MLALHHHILPKVHSANPHWMYGQRFHAQPTLALRYDPSQGKQDLQTKNLTIIQAGLLEEYPRLFQQQLHAQDT
jgi:hypothetical protein